MAVMDPLTFELLSAPPLPAAHHKDQFDDDYLRAIGALPPRRLAACALASSIHHAAAILHAPPYAAALDAHPVSLQQPVLQPRKRAAPASDAAAAAAKKPAKRPRLPEPDSVHDYEADIDFNLREMERNAEEQPSPDYLHTVQRGQVTPWMRSDLVSWMDGFARYHDLPHGTLHRAVSYVDRFLSKRTLPTTTTRMDYQLRLLGATAVFTAAKYEERYTSFKLNAAHIAAYCGFAASKEVVDMELDMLAALRYKLSGPTAYTFVEHFTRHSDGEQDLEVQRLAHQLAEASLVDYECLHLMPSSIAASAVFLARLNLNPAASQAQVPRWNKDFEELTGYKPTDLIAGIYSLYRMNPDPCFLILPALLHYLACSCPYP